MQTLAKTYRVPSMDNVYQFFGPIIYNSAEILLAWKITQQDKKNKQQEYDNAKDSVAILLFDMANPGLCVVQGGQPYPWQSPDV